MAEKWKISNLFRGRKGNDAENGQDPSALQGELELEVEAVKADIPSAPAGDETLLAAMKGSMLELWRKWAGNQLPPVISMAEGRQLEEIPIGRQNLERERMKLTVQMEKDAKKRLDLIKKLEKNEEEEGSLDAACQIYISRDKMVAWSFLFPPFGPQGTLRAEAVGKALEQSGVTSGIDSAVMVSIFQQPQYFKLLPIAIGTPVIEGVNGSIKEYFPREIAQEVKVNDEGVADYRSLNYVQVIEKNTVICDITPPQPGTAGTQVDGKVVEPKSVKAAKVSVGKNTTITEDGLHLVATMDGHLEFSNGSFYVNALLKVDGDVDYSTGNIDFPGDVHICGDVRENFTVRATGTIAVDGLVEAATVEAGGDLIISRGVVGDNRALLKSKGCVRVKYLENCVVYAGRCVYADCIMTSQIFSDDSINVTSGSGSVIGGALTAASCIKARMIGAQSGRRTELTLGVLPYVQNELQDIKEDLTAIERERQNLDKELAYLESRQGLEGSSGPLAKMYMRRSVLGIKEQQLLKRREKLEPMMPELNNCHVECDVIYPVTSLTVGALSWTATEIRKNCRVVYDTKTGELKEIY